MNGASLLYPKIASKILELVKLGNLEEADSLTRAYVRRIFLEEVREWSFEKKLKFIEDVTGGLGFRSHNIYDVDSIIHAGKYISWCDVIQDNYCILEIGTGLGRTAYCVYSHASPRLYITCDISPYMLAIALYDNPISEFQEVLWRSSVRVLMCDGVRLVYNICLTFDHIIHDGGPCPDSNPRLFAEHVLLRLLDIVRSRGTLSVFAGKNRRWVDKIFRVFKNSDKVEHVVTISVPGSGLRVIHVVKR